MAVLVAARLYPVQVHKLGCSLHLNFMSILCVRRHHVRHSDDVDPSLACPVEKEARTCLDHVPWCPVSNP
jgi:hypothetical protein